MRFLLNNINKKNVHDGMSLVEILLAVATFSLLTVAVIGGIIYGVQGPAISGTQVRAQQLLDEAGQAVRNIRDSDTFSNLTPGTYNLVTTGGVWDLQTITNPATEAEVIDATFNRYIVIGSGVSGKQITAYISWNQGNVSRSINSSNYLSDWQDIAIVLTPMKRGLIAYYDATVGRATMTSRQYDDVANSFGAEEDITVGVGAKAENVVLKASPIKGEAILATTNNAGTLNVYCYDDTTDIWTKDFSTTVGGTGTTLRFDVEYENTTGDVMVVYSTNTATTNEIAYRTKPGGSDCGSADWSASTNFNVARTAGIVQWITAESAQNSGTDKIAIAWADAASDLSASIWDGSSWGAEPTAALETSLEYATAAQDVQSFDIAFETSSGNLMIAWSPLRTGTTSCTASATLSATSCIKYARYTTAWQATAAIPTVADVGTNIDISANPLSTSNLLVLGAMDNGTGDSGHAYWSGSEWTGKANQDISIQAPTAGSNRIACGWLTSGATTRAICTYNDSGATNIGWVVWNGSSFTTQSDFTPTPVFASPQRWYSLVVNPNSLDTLMFTLSDNTLRLFSKRLVMNSAGTFAWSNADGGLALENTLPQTNPKQFGFTFWKVIPQI
jgi:hypothetical protein